MDVVQMYCLLVEDFRGIEDTFTYKIEMAPLLINDNLETRNPAPGDTLKIYTTKPFSSNDIFRFRLDTENVPRIDADSAASALDEILVIPNPYKVANIYEPSVTNTNFQHNRELHFYRDAFSSYP